MQQESLHLRVKIKLIKTMKAGLPKTVNGESYLKLKNKKIIYIRQSYYKYVVEYNNIKNNNMTLDQLVDYIIEEGK